MYDKCYHLQEDCCSVLDKVYWGFEIQNEENNCSIEKSAAWGRYK